MYIDTHTKSSMEKSICDYLSITGDVLYGLFEYAGSEAQQDKYLNGDKLDKVFRVCFQMHKAQIMQEVYECKMNESKETHSKLVITGSDPAKFLQFQEKCLNQMAFLVQTPIHIPRVRIVGLRRDAEISAMIGNILP